MRTKVMGALLVGALLVAGCGGNSDSDSDSDSKSTAAPKAGGELTVAHPLAPFSLDPIAGTGGGDQMSLYPIYDRLVNFDPETLEPQPGLATAWDYPDPQTLVLTLQEGVTFQDGTPMDAEAVKASLERAADPDISKVASDLTSIESIEASSPTEVTIHLSRPDTSLVLIMADRAGMVVSPTAVEEEGADFAQHPVGAGPFSFVSYTPNDNMVLEKNADYWQDGKPYLDKITFKYISDQQTANNALQSHQVDMVLNVALADVSTLKQMSGVEAVVNPSLLTAGCYMQFARPPFDDTNARLAVAYGIDREALNESYAFGLDTPTSEVFPKEHWAFAPDLQDTYAYDPDKAKELLTEAGHPDGISVSGLVFQGTGEIRRMEIIQQQLKAVGIDLTFDVFDAPTVSQKFFTEHGYDIVCASWSGRPDPSQTGQGLFLSTSFYNTGFNAPGMDDALAEAASAQTQEERAAAFATVSDLNQQYAMWIPLLSEPNVTGVSDDVQGVVPNLYGKIDVSFLSKS